ncbi:class I SAM-dependent methyltransferase [Aquibacillus sp. 3ASR75-11]|uniref:Class I SAM-dependent methyltransferase n=1 Tax=Terrihalobacillus insolitus TaxID=2950438 RepID=A0A9X3WU97_9BACI|nr:class I SAM-dependent methyltransferase [Terrihalobacillus insolitus]MDC3413365.1 class I SAM-dependent methyltransferase [Terrihalobacillus insolitus]MDC3424948.1 class I SAM-dependent methyltransferase [Terrihalobacillus insolitus]
MNSELLSKRLRVVASFLPKQAVFADIGSDHAYLPCFICKNDKTARAIAGEINEGPYESAKKQVKALQLECQVSVRKGDGLDVIYPNEVQQLVIAGMGGTLITSILEKGKQKLNRVDTIITQPNVDARSIRIWFLHNGYLLTDEQIIEEDGHIYEVLIGKKGDGKTVYQNEQVKKQLLMGPYLIQENSATFKKKWEVEREKRQHALTQMNKAKVVDNQKVAKFKHELQMIEEVLTK